MARIFCFIAIASTISLLVRLIALPRHISIDYRDCWIAAGSLVLVLTGVALFLKWNGTGFGALLESLIFGHIKQSVNSRAWYSGPHLRNLWIVWAVAGVGTAAVVSLLERYRARWHRDVLPGIQLVFGATAAAISLIRGWLPDSGIRLFQRLSLLAFAPPFSWLALSSPSEKAPSTQSFARTLLCATALLQILYAYPIAGSQIEFIKVPLLLTAALCVGDAASFLRTSIRLSPGILRATTAVLLATVPLSYLVLIQLSRQRYHSVPSLGLRGAQRIHVEASQADQYRWLTRNVENYCDAIFGLPGLPSLNFWAAKEPLTRFNADAWFLDVDITPEQQGEIQRALEKRRDACVVYNPDLVAFWNRAREVDVNGMPLVVYIRNNFTTFAEMNHYYLLIRNSRSPDVMKTLH
jgi:hypothetical protein